MRCQRTSQPTTQIHTTPPFYFRSREALTDCEHERRSSSILERVLELLRVGLRAYNICPSRLPALATRRGRRETIPSGLPHRPLWKDADADRRWVQTLGTRQERGRGAAKRIRASCRACSFMEPTESERATERLRPATLAKAHDASTPYANAAIGRGASPRGAAMRQRDPRDRAHAGYRLRPRCRCRWPQIASRRNRQVDVDHDRFPIAALPGRRFRGWRSFAACSKRI